MRHLGVDFGEKRVGLALSDERGVIASPLETLPVASAGEACERVAEVAREEGAETVVVGLARRLNGRKGPQARACEAFAEALRAKGLAVELWDERLSSVSAKNCLRASGLSRGRRRRKIDAVAAQIILQGYLSARRNQFFSEESSLTR
ncbi:MAG: Holliday junction resolvase RuvX [Planctomycetota bacterium]